MPTPCWQCHKMVIAFRKDMKLDGPYHPYVIMKGQSAKVGDIIACEPYHIGKSLMHKKVIIPDELAITFKCTRSHTTYHAVKLVDLDKKCTAGLGSDFSLLHTALPYIRRMVTRNIKICNPENLLKYLSTGRTIHVYWETPISGRVLVDDLVPMVKIGDFLNAGLKVTVLFSDLHAFLDNTKSTWEMIEKRVVCYENVLKALLHSLDVPIDRLHVVRGKSYQLSREYTHNILRLSGQVSQRDTPKSGAEVVKQVDSRLLTGLLNPLLQTLDGQFLQADGQFGGADQRNNFILSEKQLPKLKLGKRWYMMNPMVTAPTGSKMSSSIEGINLLDKKDAVMGKILGAACPRQAEDNRVLSFYNYMVFPIAKKIKIQDKEYESFNALKKQFFNESPLSEDVLKDELGKFVNGLLAKVRTNLDLDLVRDAAELEYEVLDDRMIESGTSVTVDMNDTLKSAVELFTSGVKTVGSLAKLKGAIAKKGAANLIFPLHGKGKFHIGFLSGLIKIKSLIDRGLSGNFTILISDMEAFLDNEKVSWNTREARSEYYRVITGSVIKAMGIQEQTKVVLASSLEDQFSSEYTLNLHKMACAVTCDETSLLEGTALSRNLVPLLYALNTKLCKPDVILLGEDSKDIAELAIKLWKSVGFVAPTQLLVPVIPGCDGQRMRCSSPKFHLDPLDTVRQTRKKINRSLCEPRNLTGNVAMELAKRVVFPLLGQGQVLTIGRRDDHGGDVALTSFDELEHEFLMGSNPQFPLHPKDLKDAVFNKINGLFEVVRADLSSQAKLVKSAFPKK